MNISNGKKTFDELCNDYSDVTLLKRGGQKTVYYANSIRRGSCVIKLYFEIDNPRSQREIEIGENLLLENVPHIFEWGYVQYEGQETLYVIEQRVAGKELRELIKNGRKCSLKEAVSMLEQGLGFIGELENRGIVHRDIKPENIIIDDSGKLYFLDFGIARLLGGESITITEALYGPHTPGYAAPEQFNNLKNEIDSRADIFSLAVVVYECITGVNPFMKNAHNALEVLQNTVTITPVSYAIEGDEQNQFMALMGSMMAKYPSRRPRNAEQALDWLEAAKQTFRHKEE